MRGSPLWQIVAVMLMFAAAAVPVVRLTAPAPAPVAVAAPVPAATAETPLKIQVAFSPAAAYFKLTYLGETVGLSGRDPSTDFSTTWSVKLPPEGVELALQAAWPDGATGHAAAHVTVQFPDGHTTEKTFWGEADREMVELINILP